MESSIKNLIDESTTDERKEQENQGERRVSEGENDKQNDEQELIDESTTDERKRPRSEVLSVLC